jgi:hypothetical protein
VIHKVYPDLWHGTQPAASRQVWLLLHRLQAVFSRDFSSSEINLDGTPGAFWETSEVDGANSLDGVIGLRAVYACILRLLNRITRRLRYDLTVLLRRIWVGTEF